MSAGFFGCDANIGPTQSGGTPQIGTKPVPGKVPHATPQITADTPAAFQLTADEFSREWEDGDTEELFKKYKGKVIEVSGNVDRIVASTIFYGPSKPVAEVTLQSTDDGRLFNVRCLMIDKEPWAKLSIGQHAKIKGISTTFAMALGGTLEHCVVVERGESFAMEITAEAFAEEYSKSAETARAKYFQEPLIVDGEIAEIQDQKPENEFSSDDGVILILEGKEDVRIKASISYVFPAQAALLKVGQRVRVTGEGYFTTDWEGLNFLSANIISKK